jgi:antitoxin PrlF
MKFNDELITIGYQFAWSFSSLDKGNAIALPCMLLKLCPYRRMPIALEVESTLTDRYQTTVPETVRRALRLGKRDKIHYTILPDGGVMLTRADTIEINDPALDPFLSFLARDLANHPERLVAMDPEFIQRMQSLVEGVHVDLNQPLSADDE